MSANAGPKNKPRIKPVLILQHTPYEHAAAIRRALESQGIPSTCQLVFSDPFFPKLSSISGIISLGGPMSANDEARHSWIKGECSLLEKAHGKGLPIVGICLGAQILARALGAKVRRNRWPEIGWHPLKLNPEGLADPILGSSEDQAPVYHWHEDTIEPPEGARVLASSRATPVQAFRVGTRTYGFQFHPEADHALLSEWLAVAETEREIRAHLNRNPEFVQNPLEQFGHAPHAEKQSLRIAAGIGGHFRKGRYAKTPPTFFRNMTLWSQLGTQLAIELVDPRMRPFWLKGQILSVGKHKKAEFVLFRDETGLIWPMNPADIRGIKLA